MAKKEERELSTEEEKAAGLTDSQKALREYHEGEFQTKDPITSEDRDPDEKAPVYRTDRGESIPADPEKGS
jgi:hypothetical protein